MQYGANKVSFGLEIGCRGFYQTLVVAFHYTRAIFTHCIQFGFTYGMIYSTKAYLEAGDGNLLEAEVALKAKAQCAEAGREKKSTEEGWTKRETTRGTADQGKGR